MFVSVVILYLTYQEHRRWHHPSILTIGYLVLTILLELAEARTLWSRLGHAPIADMFAASIAVKFVIALIQELPEIPSPIVKEGYIANESTGGFSGQTLFWWPTLLLNKGYRGILTNDDLGDIDEEFDSGTLLAAITSTWANCMCQPP